MTIKGGPVDVGGSEPDPQPIKRMPISEFRALGFVQEINRQLLHPMGLALEVVVEKDGTERLGGVWDYRGDPEGINYGGSYQEALAEKAQRFAAIWEFREPDRVKALGYMVQPIEEKT